MEGTSKIIVPKGEFAAKVQSIRDQRKATSGPALFPKITKVDDKFTVFLPSMDTTGFSNLYNTFGYLAEKLGFNILMYEKDEILEPRDRSLELFWLGFLLGASEDAVNVSRGTVKKELERGRACAFHIRVRGFFRQNPNLGVEALTKDNAYYANNAEEVVGKNKVNFILNEKISSVTNSPALAVQLKSVLVSLLEKVSIPENLQELVVRSNLITYQEVIELFKIKVPNPAKGKRGQPTYTYQLPRKPRESTMFLKEEYRSLDFITKPVWQCLKPFEVSDWFQTVKTHGYGRVKAYLYNVYSFKASCARAHADLTTGRLNEVRRIADNPKLKKADVTHEMIFALLKTRDDPVGKAGSEFEELLSKGEVSSADFPGLGKYPSRSEILGSCQDKMKEGRAIYREDVEPILKLSDYVPTSLGYNRSNNSRESTSRGVDPKGKNKVKSQSG